MPMTEDFDPIRIGDIKELTMEGKHPITKALPWIVLEHSQRMTDMDKMQKAMDNKYSRETPVKKGLQFFMTMTTMYFVWRLCDCLCSIVSTGH